jgi:hypothetical protein
MFSKPSVVLRFDTFARRIEIPGQVHAADGSWRSRFVGV